MTDHWCGIDIGASTAKLIVVSDEGRVVAKAMRRSGVDYAETANSLLVEALSEAGLAADCLARTMSTGYGRHNVPWADGNMTEIACHAKGAYFHFRRAITVIDIGAQDSKVIHLDEGGRRTGFKMNRKCAAGTGAFVEEIAHRLSIPVSEMNALAERATKEAKLGSFCTVFAATEVLEKIRAGEKVEDIVLGAFGSVVKRLVEMDSLQGDLVMTGGVVANNPFLAKLTGEAFGVEAHMPPDPQYAGALGAALYAVEESQKGQQTCSSQTLPSN